MASFLILLSDNSLQAHKPKFNDELEDLVNEIDVKYPAGLVGIWQLGQYLRR